MKEPTKIMLRSKTLLDVIITNKRDTVIHAETSLSIADHHAVSCTINLRKQRMTPFQIHGRNCANYSPEIFQIKLMHLSNQLNLMYETDSIDTQVQILTDNFLLALDSCAPVEVKLIKRPSARWMTETIKNEINKKYILSHEYKSIVEDTAKLPKETEYKQEKMIIRKLIKKSKMQHYHEALNNARKNPKETWNLLRELVPGKSKKPKCNFQNPTISASTFSNSFATAGEKTYNDMK